MVLDIGVNVGKYKLFPFSEPICIAEAFWQVCTLHTHLLFQQNFGFYLLLLWLSKRCTLLIGWSALYNCPLFRPTVLLFAFPQNNIPKKEYQCKHNLKITEQHSITVFENHRKASYVYILSRKKSIKMPKMVHFDEFLKTCNLWSNSVTRLVSFIGTKSGRKCPNSKIQMRHFWVIFKQGAVYFCRKV